MQAVVECPPPVYGYVRDEADCSLPILHLRARMELNLPQAVTGECSSNSVPIIAVLEQLVAAWRAEAEQLRQRYSLDSLASLCEAHATDLRDVLALKGDQVLTLGDAVRETGYSSAYLRTLLQFGLLTNAGKRGSPRLFRSQLPVKESRDTRTATSRRNNELDFDADAAVAAALRSPLAPVTEEK